MRLTAKTLTYFDRSIIRQRWKFNRSPIARASAWVMRIARKSIRRRRNRNLASPAGTPPHSHQPGALPPFKQIFFEMDTFNMRSFIGMVGYGGNGVPVPGLQEHGGSASRQVFRQMGRRTLNRNFRTARQGGIVTRRVTTGVCYPQRPFMMPALINTLPRLPAFWKNSLR